MSKSKRHKNTATEHLTRLTVRLDRTATLTAEALQQVAAHLEASARRLRDVSTVFDGSELHEAKALKRARAEVMAAGLQASNALTELGARCGLDVTDVREDEERGNHPNG